MTPLVREITEKPWSTEDAFAYCERLTSSHYENFPVASRLIPAKQRLHVSAIYAFARTADDFADEPGMTNAERLEELRSWDRQLAACYSGEARHPVFVALRRTVEEHQIPIELLRALLQAFEADVTVHRYVTFEQVLGYCRNSANPVGRLVLLLFGYRDESLHRLSDDICTALQLTNFWQDLRIDLERDRVYLPHEDLLRFAYTEAELFRRSFTPAFKALMAFEVERTDELFRRGKPLLAEVGKDLRLELRLTWQGGREILRLIRRQDFDVFRRRPKLSARGKLKILFTALFGGVP